MIFSIYFYFSNEVLFADIQAIYNMALYLAQSKTYLNKQ